ncbi:MAG: hypothetical protein DHS20C18_41260 [Saprospiraceae bacterium]|nr:MAG: hypothetical protein DHS20C18_41260 [Saprospiraceae bacterium]
MTAYFSCSGYHYYQELVKARKNLASYINEALGDKTYQSIHFLVVHFSALTMVEEEAPQKEGDGALSMVVRVEGVAESDLAKALMDGLKNENVPNELRADLKAAFEKKGWL